MLEPGQDLALALEALHRLGGAQGAPRVTLIATCFSKASSARTARYTGAHAAAAELALDRVGADAPARG